MVRWASLAEMYLALTKVSTSSSIVTFWPLEYCTVKTTMSDPLHIYLYKYLTASTLYTTSTLMWAWYLAVRNGLYGITHLLFMVCSCLLSFLMVWQMPPELGILWLYSRKELLCKIVKFRNNSGQSMEQWRFCPCPSMQGHCRLNCCW